MEDIWFRWLGVAGIELGVQDEVLMIDPFLTRPPFLRQWFGRVEPDRALVAQKVRRCDIVLVTHAHWDHLMDVPEVVKNTGATALGSPNTCRLLAALGVPSGRILPIKAGDRLDLGAFKVWVMPAEHTRLFGRPIMAGALPADLTPPLRLKDYRADEYFSFQIHVAGWRLLDWCSTWAEAAPPADVLFAGVVERRPYYATLLREVQPRIVIPAHWDDLFRSLSKSLRPFRMLPRLAFPPLRRMSPARFARMIGQIDPHVQVLVPEIFRPYNLGRL